MAFIVEQYVGDKGIQLANEEIVRSFSFGTNWQTIRIGVRLAINTLTTIPLTSMRMGICTGLNASYTDVTVDALWWTMWHPSSATLTYLGTPPLTYVSQENSLGVQSFQKVATTATGFGSGTILRSACSANPTALRSMWLMDFTKGTVGVVSIGLSQWYRQSTFATGSVLLDATRGDFLAAMEAPTPANMTNVAVSGANLPIRTVKDWNSMFLAWPSSTPTICIYDMAVVRFT